MADYNAVYEGRFKRNLRRYAALRHRIKRRVDQVLSDPFANTNF